jgi:hypothetical protein
MMVDQRPERALAIYAVGRVHVLGPSHDVLADAPVQNIVALIDEVRNQ